MQWLEALDRDGRVEYCAAQEAGVRQRFGLTLTETEASAWAISTQGVRYAAARAVVEALAVVLDAAWLRTLYGLGPIRWVAEALYRWVAGHRHLFPGVEPFCARHPCPET